MKAVCRARVKEHELRIAVAQGPRGRRKNENAAGQPTSWGASARAIVAHGVEKTVATVLHSAMQVFDV
jgi:hypothetical protein